jgi:hypothetical protein
MATKVGALPRQNKTFMSEFTPLGEGVVPCALLLICGSTISANQLDNHFHRTASFLGDQV